MYNNIFAKRINPLYIPSYTNQFFQTNGLPSTNPVEHSNNFKIVVILDESGSMKCIKDDMIKSLNDLIIEQKQIDRPCNFTLVKFNNNIHRVIKNKNLQKVCILEPNDYIPNGSTALYDAIGNTIEWFRYESNVLMVIITDGQENSSTKYQKSQITGMLDEKRKNRNWSYVYLCNNLMTASQGYCIGLTKSKFSSNCVVDQCAYGDFIGTNLNIAISNYRKHGVSVQTQLNN